VVMHPNVWEDRRHCPLQQERFEGAAGDPSPASQVRTREETQSRLSLQLNCTPFALMLQVVRGYDPCWNVVDSIFSTLRDVQKYMG
jgi:hypothetical protein